MGKKYIIDLNPDCVEGEYLRIPARIAGEEQWLVTKSALTPYTEPDIEQVRADAYNDGYKSGREAEKVRQPDLERVKADAYLKGLNDGQGVILESTQNNAFNNGYKKCLEDMEHDKGKENSIGYKIGYKKGYIDGLNRISDYEDKIRKEAYEKGLSDAWEAARKIVIGNINFIGSAFGSGTRSGIIRDLTASEVIKVLKDYEQKQDAEIKIGNEVKAFEKKPFIVTGFGYVDNEEDVYCYGFVTENGISTSAKKNSCVRTGRHFDEIASIFKKMRGEQDG